MSTLRTASTTVLIGFVLQLPNGCERKSARNETKDATAHAAAAAEHSPDGGDDHALDVKGDDHADDDARDRGEAGHDDHAGHEPGNGHGRSGQVSGTLSTQPMTAPAAP